MISLRCGKFLNIIGNLIRGLLQRVRFGINIASGDISIDCQLENIDALLF
jgi:hypothetical protein